MRNLAGLIFTLMLLASPAFAVCPTNLQLKDNAGVTAPGKYTDDGAGNCQANVAIQDGAQVSIGAKADTAYGGSGAASVIAALKGLYASATGSIPAGTNSIGGVTVASGANVTEGAPADAAYAGSGSSTIVAALKGIYNAAVSPIPLGTTGGWTPLKLNGLSTTPTAIKAAAGQIGMLQCYNANAGAAYIQVFNVASGSVSLGTTAPTLSVPIGPTSTGGFAMPVIGVQFSTAISAAATTTATGSTALTTPPDCNVVFN